MAVHEGEHHDESLGDKMKDAGRAMKEKIGGHSEHTEHLEDRDVRDRELGGATDSERRLTLAEEELEVGTRHVPAGEVRLEKHVDIEHVREDVPVMREEVTLERHAVSNAMAAGSVEIGEQEITVPVTEEEAVAEKRAVVKEEIVVNKHPVQETRTVEADLRHEELEVKDETRTKKKRSKSKSASKTSTKGRATKRTDDSERSGR